MCPVKIYSVSIEEEFMMNFRTLVLTLALLIGFSTAIKAEGQVSNDQVPMYGGMDRT